MKKFFSMLLFLLFAFAVNAAVPGGPVKHQHESLYATLAQPVNVVMVSNAQIYQPEKGFSIYGDAYRQGDVEKSSYSCYLSSGSQSELSLQCSMINRYCDALNSTLPLMGNKSKGRYRLDIGETFSQVGVTTRHI
jgi:hypothetical protein